jgi:hypothetical protein
LDEFAVSNNNELEETPAAPIRKVSNVNGGAAGGASLVKRAMQEANQPIKKVITLDRSAASQPESSGVRDIESRLKKRSAEHEGRDLESLIRENKKDNQ